VGGVAGEAPDGARGRVDGLLTAHRPYPDRAPRSDGGVLAAHAGAAVGADRDGGNGEHPGVVAVEAVHRVASLTLSLG
jgi:hypothetical protein